MADKEADRAKKKLDSLIAEMPRIAEAVKAFPETVQSRAFDALMAELKGQTVPTARSRSRARKAASSRGAKSAPKSTKEDGKRTRRRMGTPSAIRDLDLAPKGQKSLKDFVAEKHPKTNHDRNAVSVYYLAEVRGLDRITLDHVFTCYKDLRWREPTNLANSLALTASRKRFLDTSKLDDIRLMPAGRNHVEHDLPPKKKE